jgi:energy-coupling factor transport system permease protein
MSRTPSLTGPIAFFCWKEDILPSFKLFEPPVPPSNAQEQSDAGVGRRMVLAIFLSCLAFLARSVPLLLMLSAVNLLVLIWLRRGPRSLKREMRTFCWQTLIILTLYLIRFRNVEGLWMGFKVSWQLFLAFLPVMVVSRTVSQAAAVRILNRIMPGQMAFVLSTCIRFVPQLLSEIKNIYEGQLLRGARILPRDLIRPWNWPDLLHCVVVPSIVQGMALAGNIALAARARGYGCCPQRTCWPGE